MIPFVLKDGYGSGETAKVDGEGALQAVIHPHPPFNEAETSVPYRARFTDGTTTTNMNVDGSVTNVEYFIQASTEYDIYINSLSLRIGDGGAPTLNKFGALTALTNGVEWKWVTNDLGTQILHEGIKTNLEFIRTGHKTHAIGTGTDAYLADVSGGASEKAYLPIIDISEQFGKPWGIRLRKGTIDKMVFVIRDDLTGLINFDCIAYGTQF
jgi:hypothetical protein